MLAVVSFIVHWIWKDTHQQQSIEEFCKHILNGQNKQLYQLINNYASSFELLEDTMTTTSNLESSFKAICEELFKLRPAKGAYIIAILGYALKLNKYHTEHSQTWYKTELLTCSLTNILKDQGFDCVTALEDIVNDYCKCILF